MMQTAAAAVAMAAAWQTEQRATCDSTRLWRRQLGQVFRTAMSAVFFCRCHCFYSLSFSHFLLLFLLFFWRIFLSLSLCVWRQVGVAAAAWRKVFRFPSGRTYTVSTLPRQLQQSVCMCVWESVCASLCQWQRGVCLFFLRTVGHFWQTQQQQQQRRLRVQPTIDGTAIL